MSWKEAVLNVANEMLAEVEDLKGLQDAGSAYTRNALKGYARTLKAICDSAGDPPPQPPIQPPVQIVPTPPVGSYPFVGNPFGGISADLQNHLEVEKAKAEFRKKKSTEVLEERHDGDGVMFVGGPADGTFTTIDPNMPVGARTFSAGAAYQLQLDNENQIKRLVFDEKETERVQLSLLARKGGD